MLIILGACQAEELNRNAVEGEPIAVAYHSRMPKKIRRQILKDFRVGRIRTVCTRDMFNEGVNIPDATILTFTRLTGSEAIYFQQLGRGLRGKNKKVTVLDFVANVERIARVHALSEAVRRHAGEIGEQTNESLDKQGGDTGLRVQTNHTEFDFEKMVIDLLEKFDTLRTNTEPNPYNDFSNDELVELAQRVKPEGPLTVSAIVHLARQKEFASIYTIRTRFGSLREFHVACGFNIDSMTNEQLIALAKDLKSESPLTATEMDSLRKEGLFVNPRTVSQRFGSIIEFQRACGFEVLNTRRMTNDDLVALALEIKPHGPLNAHEMGALSKDGRFVGPSTITSRFGSLQAFRDACGFNDALDVRSMGADVVVALALELKPTGPLTMSEITELSKQGKFVSVQAILTRFGALSAFQEACGFRNERTSLTGLNNSELVALALEIKPDGPLATTDFKMLVKEGRFVSYDTIRARFGSLANFQEACGFSSTFLTRTMSNDEVVGLALQLSPDAPLSNKDIKILAMQKRFLSAGAVRQRFGSLEAFYSACGFEIRKLNTASMSNQDILKLALGLQLDPTISQTGINKLSKTGQFVSAPTLRSRFGSVENFMTQYKKLLDDHSAGRA